jgi:hypothetical protein
MKGDFSRVPYDRKKQYSSVLMQQGRVQLDADWNEHARLLLHRLETLAEDLIGFGGGPHASAGGGFELEPHVDERDFFISAGRYYAQGLLVENGAGVFFSSHAAERGTSILDPKKTYLVYLDAWEDFVSAAEDPSIREIALNGTDTAGRAQVRWRVRVQEIADGAKCNAIMNDFPKQIASWQGETRGRLRARVNPGSVASDDPCIIPPSNRYRGAENQLYRVEIHRGGAAGGKAGTSGATFKWSRENGSVVYPVSPNGISGQTITVDNIGRDINLSLRPGDWVELDSGSAVATQKPAPLLRVARVEFAANQIVLHDKIGDVAPGAVVRRWDQKAPSDAKGQPPMSDGVPIREGDGETNWIALENGLEVQFQKKDTDPRNNYRIGDYWLIPARTANSGQIDWPSTDGDADFVLPHGIRHRYAPLAAIQFSSAATNPDHTPILCHLRKDMGVVVDIVTPDPGV